MMFDGENIRVGDGCLGWQLKNVKASGRMKNSNSNCPAMRLEILVWSYPAGHPPNPN